MEIHDLHPKYVEFQNQWQQIKDCLAGEEAIKANFYSYLPFPVALPANEKNSYEFRDQYEIYLFNSQFIEFTSEAVKDLLGAIFSRDPIIDDRMPEELEYFDLSNLARELCQEVISYGRCFVLIDYPSVDENISLLQEQEEEIRAYYTIYNTLDVINWSTKRLGDKTILTRVVLVETEIEDNEEITYYRELLLEENIYKIRRYNDDGDLLEELTPKANGNVLNSITGTFVGSVSNTPTVDKSPIIGISNANLKHFQTTAELRHSLVYMGHPMISVTNAPVGFIAEMTERQERINIGPNNAVVVEEGGNTSILQLTGELQQFKELERLERSMAEMGYKLKSDKSGVESAEALLIRNSGSSSQLASIASQVENAVQSVLEYLNLYMAMQVLKDFIFDLNKIYLQTPPNENLINVLDNLVMKGRIPSRILYDYLVAVNLLNEDEDYEKLEAESESLIQMPPIVDNGEGDNGESGNGED